MSHSDTPEMDERVQRLVNSAPPSTAGQRKALATLVDTGATETTTTTEPRAAEH
jgi:hypothetical protein